MITLYLIRHADAEINSFSGKDIDRKLSNKGINQCVELKKKIQPYYWEDVQFFISSSERTKQTFNFVFNDFKGVFCDELYLASVQSLLKFLNDLNSNKSICIISHNEGISALASILTGQRILMNTCSFLELSFQFESTDYISAETASIVNFIS
jgi:phosphohistidine phosphatase